MMNKDGLNDKKDVRIYKGPISNELKEILANCRPLKECKAILANDHYTVLFLHRGLLGRIKLDTVVNIKHYSSVAQFNEMPHIKHQFEQIWAKCQNNDRERYWNKEVPYRSMAIHDLILDNYTQKYYRVCMIGWEEVDVLNGKKFKVSVKHSCV